jgi:ferritin-like metal-binding protein YciE
MKCKSLSDVYLFDLREMNDAERQLDKALPKLAERGTNEALRSALLQCEQDTADQIRRLNAVFDALGERTRSASCVAMAAMLTEATIRTDADTPDDVVDALLITVVQRVQHFQIAAYGSLRAYARLLRRYDDAALLQESLEEERQTDERLTRIAEGFVNTRALM